jgi:hypothetical protein
VDVREHTLETSIDEFLDRRLFCFLAQQSDNGPRVSPLWFLWEETTLWVVAQLADRSYPERVQQYPSTAVAVVDFAPATGRVEHVGMRGHASLEPYDTDRAARLFQKYLGPDRSRWPEMFVGLDTDTYRLIQFQPETVVARDQSYAAPSKTE